jgi:hypothetical protein
VLGELVPAFLPHSRKHEAKGCCFKEAMRPATLKETVDRIIGGESRVDAISELLNEFCLSGPLWSGNA